MNQAVHDLAQTERAGDGTGAPRRWCEVRYLVTTTYVILVSAVAQGEVHLADYVNTLQGPNSRFELSRGNTYPAVAMPFGMHTWTAQTGRNGDGWKYQYHKNTIRGFQQAHQCSSWSNDYLVFSLMPVVAALVVNEDARATRFRHQDEVAKPYYYHVKLDNGVEVEIAPTERGAFLRIEFPPTEPAFLVVDGYTGFGSLQVASDRQRIMGSVRNGRNLPRGFRNHFVLEFDVPCIAFGTWRQGRNSETVKAGVSEIIGRRVGTYLEFPRGTTLNVRVASSYIDPTQAELNLDRELSDLSDIESAREGAREAWNATLGKVLVAGGTEEQRRTFYSCMFRASLFPRKFYEHDMSGEPYYRSPYDGDIHRGYMYTDTGLWDTFRAQMPLRTLLYPEMQGRYMQALLAAYEQCGWLPSWSFPGEAGSMIGNHAISLLADAWVKGLRTFEPAEALSAYEHESLHKGPWGPANGRQGAPELEAVGYLPYPKHREAVAKTLEYAYDDFCGYRLAQVTGQDKYAQMFGQRMLNYQNLFDPVTGFMRGKDEHGQWHPQELDPSEWGGPFTEGCAWHWLWSVFHDIAGLIELMGGDEAFIAKLDAVFAAPSTFQVGTYGAPIHEMREMVLARMGQYAHGNQPMQHMVYLYNYAGQPWKTQMRARAVMSRLYSSNENGYPGDEDQGQTSSWYVLSALGLYCVCPGTDEYVLGSPLFDKAMIALDNGRKFVIAAENNATPNVYIQSADLNGREYPRSFLRHSDIIEGGELQMVMDRKPNTGRGVSITDRPYSVSTSTGVRFGRPD
jgi:predicted alpha-1,2-mannosidase